MQALASAFHPASRHECACDGDQLCDSGCRLSCEKFFVLASVFCAFLLFREPPLWVRHVISAVATLSAIFQKVCPSNHATLRNQ